MRTALRSRRSIAQTLPENFFADSLYPSSIQHADHYPTLSEFEVFSDSKIGKGIRAKVDFTRGTTMARFTGQLTREILQHTLQVTPTSHVHDPYFIGLLSHSCAPNCLLDMTHLELLALTDIQAGTRLTVDYALTEDSLFRQFPCDCGSASCRGWITGRREMVNAKGRDQLLRRASKS